MPKEYSVKSYKPTIKGCGAVDVGWDEHRCADFEKFINDHASLGWCLHSYEYRAMKAKGCGEQMGAWLVCVFEREK